jgi:hypothetical protein
MVVGDPRGYADRLRSFAYARGIAVECSDLIAPARGMSSGGKITLLPGQSSAVEFSTLVHELAHELLHRGDHRSSTSRSLRETEAEATAFVVCHAIGLETNSAASDYIQLWKGVIRSFSPRVSATSEKAASAILGALTDA